MIKTLINSFLTLAVLGIVFVGVFYLVSEIQRTESATISGIAAGEDDVRYVAVGPTENIQIFNKSPRCASRVITTETANIRFIAASSSIYGFATSTSNLSATRGHLQSASTTATYDSGLWGCGYWAAYAYSSTTITVSERY